MFRYKYFRKKEVTQKTSLPQMNYVFTPINYSDNNGRRYLCMCAG